MSNGTRLVKTIQQMAKPFESDKSDVIIGEVISVEPLKIKVDKVELTESFLVLGALVKDTVITGVGEHIHSIDEQNTESAGSHNHTYNSDQTSVEPAHVHAIPSQDTNATTLTIKLWGGLQVNDIVYLLRLSGGQKYFVLQKIGGIV